MVVRKFLLPFFLHLTYGILPALFADSFSCISNTLASLISLLDGVSSARLCQAIRARGKSEPILIAGLDELSHELPVLLQADDLVLLLGAGDIGRVGDSLCQETAG